MSPSPDHHVLIRVNDKPFIANWRGHNSVNTQLDKPSARLEETNGLYAGITDVLDSMSECGWSQQDITNGAAALGISQAEVMAWAGKTDDGTATPEELAYRCALEAYICHFIIENRATISDPRFLQATTDELHEWSEWYAQQTREAYNRTLEREQHIKTGRIHEDAQWALARAELEKLAGYLWMTERRLGQR